MDFKDTPLSELLQNREIFAVFDKEFQKTSWLDLTALLRSESSIKDLYADTIVPHEVLDNVVKKLDFLEMKTRIKE